MSRDDYVASFLTVLVVAILVYVSIWITDAVVQLLDPGYIAPHSPLRASAIFVAVGFPFALYMRLRDWTRIAATLIASIALFMPITFLNTAASLVATGDEPVMMGRVLLSARTDDGGPEFARFVYVQILRALPTVVLAPFAFWFVFVRIFGRSRGPISMTSGRGGGGHE